MAGGKSSPRQKMINLMYLIFIAMLAMNMSKEVLSAFGILENKISKSNESIEIKNKKYYENLATKAHEQPEKYNYLEKKANEVKKLSDDYFNYLEKLKTKMIGGIKNPKDYVKMDQSSFLDEHFFKGDGLKKQGKEFLRKINNYRTQVIKQLKEYDEIVSVTKQRFDTSDVIDREGVKKTWLSYNYEGFPLIASLTNISQIQSDIRNTEADMLSNLLKGQLENDVSMTKYDAKVIFDKNAYYAGEKLSGRIILGKNDPTLLAEKVILNGKQVDKSKIKAGQVLLDDSAGNIGDHTLIGNFFFKENDSLVKIPIKGSYSVIPKPNQAFVSADKMNVVYRGLSNPLTISIPGIPANKVTASAPGLRQVSGSTYSINPGLGKQVAIKVLGKLSDGSVVNTKKIYRIKDIPAAMGIVRGQFGTVRMPKNSLNRIQIGAGLPDFLFDLNLKVLSFKVKVPGELAVKVNGTQFNSAAKTILSKARRGDIISIFDIKAKVNNSSYTLKKVLPVNIELIN